jgi:positive regulator of sigma E activity
MPLVQGIIFGFVTLLIVGAVNMPAPWDVLAVFLGTLLGYLLAADEQRDRRQRRIDQEAAQQERQARLIADAIAEREARQRLGEFNH